MHALQNEHIATVMRVAEDGIGAPRAMAHDEIIRASWSRGVHEHRLDPTRMQEAVIAATCTRAGTPRSSCRCS